MSAKRKIPSMGLERRVRPRRDEEIEIESDIESGDDASDNPSEDGSGSDEDDSNSHQSGSEEESKDEAPQVDVSTISFGALARAQASLPSARQKREAGKSTASDDEGENEEDSKFSKRHENEKRAPKPKRSSKHAPQEQSSRKQVSRIIRPENMTATKRAASRDPRFDAFGDHMEESKARKVYAFLDEYRDKELAAMKAELKKCKSAARKETLKKDIMSMENKKKAQARKDEQERLLKEHRAKEKELVAQGKTPFYLKKSEQKKQLLTKQFEGMSQGARDRAVMRKRKKVAGKEKKELDFLHRRRTD